MIERAPGRILAGSIRRSGSRAIQAMSPWNSCSSQRPRNSPCGAPPTRAIPTFSKPSSWALLLMEFALLIVVVREAARRAEFVALVDRIGRRPAVGGHAAVADRAVPGDEPEREVDQRRDTEYRDGVV